MKKKFHKILTKNFNDHKQLLNVSERNLTKKILYAVDVISNCIKNGNLLLWCGNGGSASDSMHLSTEFIGRFKKNRKPLRSLSLASDQSTITCIANDFGYEKIFSRQIEGLGKKNDVLVCLTTSGNSLNIINAIHAAKKKNIKTILISGNKGGKCTNLCNLEILIPSNSTARIQEIQLLIGHSIIETVEKKLNIVK